MVDINKEIESLNWQKEPRGLYEPIEYALASGGKRVRPTLALIAAEAIVNGGLINGDAIEQTLPAALALEVFHNFTLLHDDVMDRAEVRRGRPTVHVKWNDNTAILSGDQMLIEAYKLLSNVPADKLPQVLKWFNEMATGICEGQQYDVDFEHMSQVTINDYMKMIELKTSVLLANAMRIGGYIAGATPVQQEALYQYGLHLGLAFQVQDDILDVYGDPKTFGKAIRHMLQQKDRAAHQRPRERRRRVQSRTAAVDHDHRPQRREDCCRHRHLQPSGRSPDMRSDHGRAHLTRTRATRQTAAERFHRASARHGRAARNEKKLNRKW